MVRTRCQACQKVLRIDDAYQGKTAKCPACGLRFVVPAAEEPADAGAGEAAVGSYVMREERAETAAPRPAPRRRPRRVEDDEDHPRPRRRRRRGGSFFADWGVGKILLTVAGGVWLVLLGASILFPPCAFLLIILGFLMIIAARIWIVVAAFSEDAGMGCLVVALPWYGLWSLEDQRPLLLFGAGFLFVLSAIAVLFVDHLLGVF